MAKRRKKIELPSGLRGVVARNLEEVRSKVGALNSEPKIAAKAKIGQSTVGRIARAEVAATLDNIEALAKAVNVLPWQLLVPDLDPLKSPTLGGSFPIEEAQAMVRLRRAHPDWRRYVLGLALIDSPEAQELLLKTMREAVPNERVEQAYGKAPHVAARRERERP